MAEPTQIFSWLRAGYWLFGLLKKSFVFLRDEVYYNLIRKETFYFTDYCKHLTIYRNGHGILINSCEIKVLKKDKFEQITRSIDISDSKKFATFEPLEIMKKDSTCDRFTNLGFWSRINTVGELLEGIEAELSDDKKKLDFVFKFNKGVLKSLRERVFKLSYALTIPGMFPISEGYVDMANKPEVFEGFFSCIAVRHRVEQITYIVSFEKGIHVDKSNISFYNEFKKSLSRERRIIQKDLNFSFEPDVFYDKYLVKIIKPRFRSEIFVKWNVKEDPRMERERGD